MTILKEAWYEEAHESDEPSLRRWANQLEEIIAEAQDLMQVTARTAGAEDTLGDLQYEARCIRDEIHQLVEEFPERLSSLQEALARVRAGRIFDAGSSLPGATEEWDEVEVGEKEEWESDWPDQE